MNPCGALTPADLLLPAEARHFRPAMAGALQVTGGYPCPPFYARFDRQDESRLLPLVDA